MAAAAEDDVAHGHNEQQQQHDDNRQRHLARLGVGSLYVVQAQLVADALHAVRQHHVVDGVAGLCLLAQRLVGVLPAAANLVDLGGDVVGVVALVLARYADGLVDVAPDSLVVGLQGAAVNGGLALGHALTVGSVAFHELYGVAAVEVAQRAARLNVEHAVGRILGGYVGCLVE